MKAKALDKSCHLCTADNPTPSFKTEDAEIVGGESPRSTFKALEESHCAEVAPVGVEECAVNSAVGLDSFPADDGLFRLIFGPRLATGMSKLHCVPDSRQFVHL